MLIIHAARNYILCVSGDILTFIRRGQATGRHWPIINRSLSEIYVILNAAR